MSPDQLEEMARGKWAGLLGRWMTERSLAGKHDKCPLCQTGKDKFRFDNLNGRGTWLCSQCGAGTGFHFLQQVNGWTFAEAAKYVEQNCGKIQASAIKPAREIEDIRASLRRVWEGSKRLEAGDPVMQYLTRRCGIKAPPAGVRYHPALPYTDDDGVITQHPAMVSQVLDQNGKPVTIHRLWLTEDGQKADVATVRKLCTPTVKLSNVAVRLAPPVDGWLGVGEGIETCLAASIRFQLPMWSVINAGLMKTFRPPADVKLLFVMADNDRSFVGQAAACELARAVIATGVECRVYMPEEAGSDFADYSENFK